MAEKKFIAAQELIEDSFRLGLQVFKSGFKPSFIVGIWRGGTPVGVAVQELLDFFGIHTDHIAIRTSSYDGMERRESAIKVHGLDYIVKNINSEDGLLIVDDVYDTGLSVQAVIGALKRKCRKNTPEDIRIATVYFKPDNNRTDTTPDYYVYETDRWLVFPHELKGLTKEEIYRNKPVAKKIIAEVLNHEN